MPPIIAIDFESFYTKEYSLRLMSTWKYVHDPRFNAYLVAAYGPDIKVACDPREFDWSLLRGAIVAMHNASFDEVVLHRLQELGIAPQDLGIDRIICTADLAAYLGVRRDLATASRILLGETADKTVRAQMKGLTFQEAKDRGIDVVTYGCEDARLCHALAAKYLDQWPETEQQLSRLNREAGYRGVQINSELTHKGHAILTASLEDAKSKLPWVKEGVKPLSPKAMRDQGELDGIPTPASFAKDDPKTIAWEAEYGDQFEWIRAVRDYRRINILLTRVSALRDGTREDGTMPYQIKYGGAHTLRFSGGGDSGGKFNMQNMPRTTMYGVDLRPMIIPRPGYVLVPGDYEQIEARLLLWRAGDTDFLETLRVEGNLYQAYAKNQGAYSGTQYKIDDPAGYQYTKACCLGLGYQCGWDRFKGLAESQYGLRLTAEEAQEAVRAYRESNPKVVQFWQQHQHWLNASASHGDETHEVVLASGRIQTYWNPRKLPKARDGFADIMVYPVRGLPPQKMYGGKLTENEMQSTARDVLRDAWLAVEAMGVQVLFTVHDELIMEVLESEVDARLPEIKHAMETCSPWAAGCPLTVELSVCDHYQK